MLKKGNTHNLYFEYSDERLACYLFFILEWRTYAFQSEGTIHFQYWITKILFKNCRFVKISLKLESGCPWPVVSAMGTSGVSVSMTGMSGFFKLHLWLENNAGPKNSYWGRQVWAGEGISAWRKTWGHSPCSSCQLLGKMSADQVGGGVCVWMHSSWQTLAWTSRWVVAPWVDAPALFCI